MTKGKPFSQIKLIAIFILYYDMIYSILAVFIGSGIGGVCRWAMSNLFNGSYPIGTILANVVGCFVLGIISKNSPGDPHIKLLLTTGFCGGFTTFSTFMNEDFLMMKGGQLFLAIVYMLTSLSLGLLSAWAGWNISIRN